MPSRSASIGSALATKSGPSSARSRPPSASNRSPGSGASRSSSRGASGSERSVRVKPTPGAAIARRRTTSAIACASARSLRRNFSRAGVAENRPSSSTTVPRAERRRPRRRDARRRARVTVAAAGAPAAREVSVSRPTAPSEGSASPRKPKERMRVRSRAVDLRGRVPLERQRQLVRRDAVAVVLDPDQPLAAVGEGDLDAPGAGVERVLDQLLDRRGRPLDHLARGDPVRRRRVELPDRPAVGLYIGVAARSCHKV